MKKIHITRLATVAGLGALAVASIAGAVDKKSAPQPVVQLKVGSVEVVQATPEQIARFTATNAPSSVGMRAYVDADTGKLRPATQAELNDAAASANATTSAAPDSKVVRMANGAKRASLGEKHLSYAVATIGPDGKLKSDCVEQQPNAEAALRTASVKAKAGVARDEK